MDKNVSDDLYDKNDDEEVKKIQVSIDTDDDDDDDDEYDRSSNSELKSKIFKFMIFIVIGMVIFLLILFIISLFTKGKKNYSYESVEEIMKQAAISYFNDYPSYLPSNDGGIVEVDVANLVAAGKMKDLSSYISDGDSCSGSVLVEKNNTDYSYRPYLNCGESYSSIEISKRIINDNSVVTSGYGLYRIGDEYIFRGEELNNYVSLDSVLWRIVKITSDGEIVLIRNDSTVGLSPWDDRYNDSVQANYGFNNYGASRIRENLQKLYEKTDDEYDGLLLSDDSKKKLTPFVLCIGKRSFDADGKNNQLECSEILENQKIGLLSASDYMMASIDPNCNRISDKSCSNYNYLATNIDEWWLLTASTDNNYTLYYIDRSGRIDHDNALIYKGIRPVIHLSKNNIFKSGKGTFQDPYVLK